MKKIFQTISVSLLSIILLAGFTGISLKVHECRGSGTREVFVYSEIFGGQSECCCLEDVQLYRGDRSSSEISEEACCKNSHLYLKADFNGFRLSYQGPTDPSVLVIPGDLPIVENTVVAEHHLYPEWRIGHPPPLLSGTELLHFLHQIKIPTHLS